MLAFKGHLKGLRSKITLLELEVTVLKAQRVTDRGSLNQYERDVVALRNTSNELCVHLRRMTKFMDDFEAIWGGMRQPSSKPSAVQADSGTPPSSLTRSNSFTCF